MSVAYATNAILKHLNATSVSIVLQYFPQTKYTHIITYYKDQPDIYLIDSHTSKLVIEIINNLIINNSYIKNSKKNYIVYFDKGKISKHYVKTIMDKINDAGDNYIQYMCPRIFIVYEEYSYDHMNLMNIYELNSNYINVVPTKYKSYKKCMLAYNHIHENIKYMPKNMITSDIAMEIFQINNKYFEYIPNKYKTQEMCDILVKHDPSVLLKKQIPTKYITSAMCADTYVTVNSKKQIILQKIEIIIKNIE